jgi:hypothetical protein
MLLCAIFEPLSEGGFRTDDKADHRSILITAATASDSPNSAQNTTSDHFVLLAFGQAMAEHTQGQTYYNVLFLSISLNCGFVQMTKLMVVRSLSPHPTVRIQRRRR